MLFFQCLLVLGYLYAHWVTQRLSPKTQRLLHTILLALSTLALPILPGDSWRPADGANPVVRILTVLAVSVGLPYLMLSTTGPLIQAWFTRSRNHASPYRLFALSNLGSMLALLAYPPFVEPLLTTKGQAYTWSLAYTAFALLCTATAVVSLRAERWIKFGRETEEFAADGPVRPQLLAHCLWFGLAACASTLLLAVTNHLCQDVASIPFLWILPLGLYLLTFILSFDAPAWYQRKLFLFLLAPALAGMTYLLWSGVDHPKLKYAIPLFCAAFFAACMFCHGELARLKPHPRYLTSFYLMISLGGASGGMFVGIVAPWLFPAYFEFPIGISLCAVLAAVILHRDSRAKEVLHFKTISPELSALAAVIVIFNVVAARDSVSGYAFTGRNFYGSLRVRQTGEKLDEDAYRTLLHGTINHGEQRLAPDQRNKPQTYYCEDTGVAQALQVRSGRGPRRVGVIGLGTGTLAAYGHPGDSFRFYEINPLVVRLARTYFTYLQDSAARVDVVLGDARQSLEREDRQQFDVLAVDAFSSDSIPVHLLTREAVALYFHHLKPDGLLAVHVSNRSLDLVPVLQLDARDLQRAAVLVETEDDPSHTCYGTTWVVVANAAVDVQNLPRHNSKPMRQVAGLRAWTDDYSNLFQILK